MKDDSLTELKSAFAKWRRSKKYAREAVPQELVDRARQAVGEHGLSAVARVTGVERSRLVVKNVADGMNKQGQGLKPPASVPEFSRMELAAPARPGALPLAEVETACGVTLRVYQATPAMLSLLAAAYGIGSVR